MTTELDRIYAGATLDFLVETLTDYPASAGWTLRLVLTPLVGASNLTVNSVADGDAHRLQATASTTGAWAAGSYGRQVWVIKGGEQYPVTDLFGQTEVRPGINAAAGTDMRSAAERNLAAVKAQLGAKGASGVEMYRINGRELRSYQPTELMKLHQMLTQEVNQERVSAGLSPLPGTGPRRILVRM